MFDCARMLDELELIEDKETFLQKKELGTDISSDYFDEDTFLDLMKSRRGMIKSSLMDQNLMTGIGNECSDEILFQAHIHPKNRVDQLSKDELQNTFGKIEMVVKTKMEFLDHDKNLLKSFILKDRTEGSECPSGGGTIEKIKIGGRWGIFVRSVSENKRERYP